LDGPKQVEPAPRATRHARFRGVTYREPDAERSRSAAQEREVAGWLQAMEATRAERSRPPSRSALLWLLIVVGPGAGGAVTSMVASLVGAKDRSLLVMIGGLLGFVAAIALALRLALRRKDGLRP
jgi:hypothetical protein